MIRRYTRLTAHCQKHFVEQNSFQPASGACLEISWFVVSFDILVR
jgi:hypothetical protein